MWLDAFSQVELEESHQKRYVNLSLSDTLSQLIVDNHTKDADKIRGDFKVPDKRFGCRSYLLVV